MRRTLVVGDIHGGKRALEQVLERAEVKQRDRVVFLGDLVDGWSESAQIIDYLMELSGTIDCLFIKGNHDELCENWLKKNTQPDLWLKSGGSETIQSYESHSPEQRKEHLAFFERMPLFHIDHQNRLFVHAGFTNMKGVLNEFHASMFSWDRTLWEMALVIKEANIDESSPSYPKRLRHYSEIFIGHTPTTEWGVGEPMQAGKVWNLDTGAAFKGCLSIMDVDTKEFWQSDPVFELYPDERGRN